MARKRWYRDREEGGERHREMNKLHKKRKKNRDKENFRMLFVA